MRIASNRIEYEGDKSPDTTTKSFRILTLQCRNKKCKNYNKDVKETRTQM